MSLSSLSHIRIILVEPAGPLNVGAIARVMKNMGLQQLVLVNPQCDPLSAEARQMAVHALELLEMAQVVPTLTQALVGCRRAIATTGRDHTTLNISLETPRQCLPWLLEPFPDSEMPPMALIFGREDRGLTNEELNYAQRFLHIPASSAYISLNLAQAAAVCCYELHLSATNAIAPLPPSSPQSTASAPGASLEQLEGYYQQLESLLLKIGYLYPHTAASRMEKFRRLFHRAYLSDTEVAMLRGVLSQMEWAIAHAAALPPIQESEFL